MLARHIAAVRRAVNLKMEHGYGGEPGNSLVIIVGLTLIVFNPILGGCLTAVGVCILIFKAHMFKAGARSVQQ